jgi:hypothetical protein
LAALLELLKWAIPGGRPYFPTLNAVSGIRWTAGAALEMFGSALFVVLLYLFLMFVLRALLRKTWLYTGVFILLAAGLESAGTSRPWVDVPLGLAVVAIMTFVLLRLGLLATIVAYAVPQILLNLPITLDSSSWYFGLSMIPIVLVAAVAIYGFRISLAGRKILRSELI